LIFLWIGFAFAQVCFFFVNIQLVPMFFSGPEEIVSLSTALRLSGHEHCLFVLSEIQKMENGTQYHENKAALSDRRSTEFDYHKRLNVGVVAFILPVFLFLALYYLYRDNYLQTIIFFALIVNGVVSLIWLSRVPIEQRYRPRNISVGIAFGLMALSIFLAMLGHDVYIALPYIFSYIMALPLFFGPRTGLYGATVFCAAAIAVVLYLSFPQWTAGNIKVFKIHIVAALLIVLAINLISETSRVRMRDKLIKARNLYKEAEGRQRETNLELKSEIELRTQSEKALTQSERRYRTLFEDSAVALWEEDWSELKPYLDGLPLEAAGNLLDYLKNNRDELKQCISKMHVTAVNRATLELSEVDTKQTLMKNLRKVLPQNASNYLAERMVALYETGRYDAEATARTIHGRKVHVMISCTVPSGYEDSWERIFTSVNDVTEKVAMAEEKARLDRQLRHSQQFQALATLAGGISHRFNNALAAIVGNLDLLELTMSGSQENLSFIRSLRTSANTISGLTEQLIAYAQGGKYQPRELCVNKLIDELLRNSKAFGKATTRVVTKFEKSVDQTVGDETQIKIVMEQVLANAVEATTSAGSVTVTTYNQSIAGGQLKESAELKPGAYVVTRIEDSGVGMDEQTCRRVFEPFFSTKFVGRGLGMAAAFGIVKNHNGAITVDSEPGMGTEVTIYLPAVSNQAGL